MTAGTPVKNFRLYGWETYNWSTASQPAVPGVWTTVTATPEATANRAIAVAVTCAYAGSVSVQYGKRPGSYTSKTPPVAVQPATPVTIRLSDLSNKTTYYINPVFSGSIPNSAGLPVPAQAQYGEVSAATT